MRISCLVPDVNEMLNRLAYFKHCLQVIESKGAQNTVKRFQQKIQDFLSRAPDAEAAEETTVTNTETRAEESINGGLLCSFCNKCILDF